MNPLTSEQITQIAPDAASVKAAKGLGLSKWVLLEQHDHTILGALSRKWLQSLSNGGGFKW